MQQPSQTAPVSRIVSSLTEKGLLQIHTESRVGFIHPLILSYLATAGFKSQADEAETLIQDAWITSLNAAGFIAAQQNESQLVDRMLADNCEPLHQSLFTAARWLPLAQENSPWRTQVMRNLASILQMESYSLPLRGAAMIALAASGMPGVGVLFRQMMGSGQAVQRQITVLGSGYIRDPKAVEDLNNLLGENQPLENCSVCLGLVSIGTKPSLEFVADALLSGSDDMRRSAAEALANSEEQGYPTLKEGAELDDVLVRKAVIFGLQRLRQPWATQIIEKLYVGDAEWVVKDAASQALRELGLPNPRIPKPYPPTYNLPWLIAFGGERGIGVAPGKAACDLLMLCLKEGNEDQRAAAINYLALHGDSTVVPALYHILYSNEVLSDLAFCAWALGCFRCQPSQSHPVRVRVLRLAN